MQALVCSSLAPTDLLLFFLLFRMVRVRVISHSKCALDSVDLEKKLLSHIKEKTVGLKKEEVRNGLKTPEAGRCYKLLTR